MKTERNIPIPLAKNLPKPRVKNISHPLVKNNPYPWGKLKVGDSFFVAIEHYTPQRQSSIKSNGNEWSERHDKTIKFTTRKVDGGVRVWRIE